MNTQRKSKKADRQVKINQDLLAAVQIPLPWQQNQWHLLVQAHIQNNLPHALLLLGPMGLGKKLFAQAFTQYLLCEQSSQQQHFCGSCTSCRLLQAGHHPNVMMVTATHADMIQVDEIRSLTEFMQRSAYLPGYRIVLIHPAQNMNLASANALLKSLEEPSENVLLILIADEIGRLPLTILSRCIKVNFSSPEPNQAVNWLGERMQFARQEIEVALKQSAGAPFAAVHWLQGSFPELRQQFMRHLLSVDTNKDVTGIEKWLQISTEQLLSLWQQVVLDLLTIVQVKPVTALINSDFNSELVLFSQKCKLSALWQFHDLLNVAVAQIKSGVPVNIRLLLEKCFIEWRRVVIEV